MGWTLAELAHQVGGELCGDPSKVIDRPVPAGSSDPTGVTFAETDEYLARVAGSGVGAVLIGRGSECQGVDSIKVDSPRLAFFKILCLADRPAQLAEGVHVTAVIHPNARVDASARIGPYVCIEEGSTVDGGASVFPFCSIGPRCTVGQNTRLMPGVVLVQDVQVGRRCIIHSGAVLGADGFKFVWDGTRQVKVPQVGGVVIEDDVEIGANTTIDRAETGVTRIKAGAKLDNLIQIGHNSSVGEHTVLASHVGVSGSVTIGKNVVAGGQVGIADHISIGDRVVLAGRTGVMHDIPEAGEYFGTPPTPIKKALRTLALQQKLPELLSRIRELEREVERLKDGG